MLIVHSIYRPYSKINYVITIVDVNNNINKTLKFTYVGSVKRMTINKFYNFPLIAASAEKIFCLQV